jgi:hypothetical protein
METVYIETSVISYLVADPSRDLVTAANQPLELMGDLPYEDESTA